MTHNGRIFAAPDLPARPANTKGKAKVVDEPTSEASPTPEEDVPAGRFTERKEGFSIKEVSLEEANKFLRIIQ